MQDQFDAVLYLGDAITYSRPAASLSEGAEYQEMRRGRVKLLGELIERTKAINSAAISQNE
jgi:hypothetical protein